jgi:dTDP-4-dehydrorhamnose 3,5-epimerase
VTTTEYFAEAASPVAPRPGSSVLDLAKMEATGYLTGDADETLVGYVRLETLTTQQRNRHIG